MGPHPEEDKRGGFWLDILGGEFTLTPDWS